MWAGRSKVRARRARKCGGRAELASCYMDSLSRYTFDFASDQQRNQEEKEAKGLSRGDEREKRGGVWCGSVLWPAILAYDPSLPLNHRRSKRSIRSIRQEVKK